MILAGYMHGMVHTIIATVGTEKHQAILIQNTDFEEVALIPKDITMCKGVWDVERRRNQLSLHGH